jgi:hypothetical protein
MPPLDPSDRPDVDGEIARIDISQDGARPPAGVWRMVENGLVENTCGVDPRREAAGPCMMGCGDTTITGVEPGVFTLETPAIGYAGTCVLLDGGDRFVCKGTTTMAVERSQLGARFDEGGAAVGTWSVVMADPGSGSECIISGAFKAKPPAG